MARWAQRPPQGGRPRRRLATAGSRRCGTTSGERESETRGEEGIRAGALPLRHHMDRERERKGKRRWERRRRRRAASPGPSRCAATSGETERGREGDREGGSDGGRRLAAQASWGRPRRELERPGAGMARIRRRTEDSRAKRSHQMQIKPSAGNVSRETEIERQKVFRVTWPSSPGWELPRLISPKYSY
jgi:hypothetical protein